MYNNVVGTFEKIDCEDVGSEVESHPVGNAFVAAQSQIVLVETADEEEGVVTPEELIARLRRPGRYAKSPWVVETPKTPGPKYFGTKHPFMSAIGVEVDEDIENSFSAWLNEGVCPTKKR